MIPRSEDSLRSSESNNSFQSPGYPHKHSQSTVSTHSNPFAASDDGSDIQLENFSYINARAPRGESLVVGKFVSEHPSRAARDKVGREASRKRCNSVDGGKTVSEWETVAADDEFQHPTGFTSARAKRSRNVELVFHAEDIFDASRKGSIYKKRRNTTIAPSQSPFPEMPEANSRSFITCTDSVESCSSLYSHEDAGIDISDHSLEEVESQAEQALTMQTSIRPMQDVARCSRASSSTSGDPFKYDGDIYSGFLQSPAERAANHGFHHVGGPSASNPLSTQIIELKDMRPQPSKNVDEAVKVPVSRKKNEETQETPLKPSLRLSDDTVKDVQPRRETDTECDWQTVTTDHLIEPSQQSFGGCGNNGTGSSLADVSDTSECTFDPFNYGSTERIIQHPTAEVKSGTYHIRTDKQTNLLMFVPKYKEQKGGGFPQNASHKFIQSPGRAAAAIRRFSNPFRHDDRGSKPGARGTLFGTTERQGSYASLDSEYDANYNSYPNAALMVSDEDNEQEGRFRWSRIRENLGRELPKPPLTILDQPLYRPGAMPSQDSTSSQRVPHDSFLSKIPRLPFPLISLPEAAMLQHFRRERGEEDHTGPAKSFIAKARTNTISTVSSSTFPHTPVSGAFDIRMDTPHRSITRPPPVHFQDRHDEMEQPAFDSNERVADILVASSAILDTPSASQTRGPTNNPEYQGLSYAPLDFHGRLPRLDGFASSTRTRRAEGLLSYPPDDRVLFTPSEANLIEVTREDILLRRRLAQKGDPNERLIFISITALTFLFPLIGLLALWGKFDSTISWCTHGEMHALTSSQRKTLRRQLLLEVILYPALIIFLAVYYSVGR